MVLVCLELCVVVGWSPTGALVSWTVVGYLKQIWQMVPTFKGIDCSPHLHQLSKTIWERIEDEDEFGIVEVEIVSLQKIDV